MNSKRPRVALLHYTAHPVTGGVESILEQHRRLLVGAGYPVTVLAGRGDAEILPEVDSRHPDVERLYLGLAHGEDCSTLFGELRERLAELLAPLLAGSDVVIAHNVMTMPFNLPLTAVLPELGKPVVAWTHDVAWINPRYGAFRRDGHPYDLLHRPAPAVHWVAISELRHGDLLSAYGVPAVVVPNGIDVGRLLRIRPATVRLLERAGVWRANPLLLVPFRITRRKRIEDAIEVAASLLPRWPDQGWVVSGPLGPHQADNREYWEQLRDLRRRHGLEDRFAFLHEFGDGGRHPVDDEMMGELYALASAVFLPSESEGFGLPLVEGMLTKTPVVGTDIPAFREIGGLRLHGVGDVAAAARALEAAVGRDQSHALATYTWEAIFPKIESVIRDALG